MGQEQYMTEEQQTEALEKFAVELDAFLRKRFGYRSQATNARLPTIDVCRKKVNLYLRLRYKPQRSSGSWPQWTLVIARISFRETRAGHGRALLEFFVEHAHRFGYDKIGVEETIPHDGIQGFCRQFFKPYGEDEPLGAVSNWLAPVSDIAQQLKADRKTALADQ